MGPVGPGVVTASFFGFRNDMVAKALPDAWEFASVDAVLEARLRGVDAALQAIFGDAALATTDIEEAAELARTAAAAADRAGRPLFAANADVPWPTEPHLVLWQAVTMLREHRGDGHVAALVTAGLDGCESHLTLVGGGTLSRDVLQPNRGWTDDDWTDAATRLRARGWLDENDRLTDHGRTWREDVETTTDELAAEPWQTLGDEGAERLAAIAGPLTQRLVEGGAFPLPNPIGASG
jgi:hypothetical protein